jgi:hypothetical protein
MRDPLDAAISHIYRAGLLIHTLCEGAGPALVNELVHVTDDLDAAIRELRTAALDDHDAFTLTGRDPLPTYWAWSEQDRRWVGMTFCENQAWLARPDLDPVEFVSNEVTWCTGRVHW